MTDDMGDENPTPKVPVSELQSQLCRLLRVRQEMVNECGRVPLELDDKIQDVRKAFGREDYQLKGKT